MTDDLSRITDASVRREASDRRELRSLLGSIGVDTSPRQHGSIMGSVPFGDSMLLASPGIATLPASTVGDDTRPYHGSTNICSDPVLYYMASTISTGAAGLLQWNLDGAVTDLSVLFNSTIPRSSPVNPFNGWAVELKLTNLTGTWGLAGVAGSDGPLNIGTPVYYPGFDGYLGFALRIARGSVTTIGSLTALKVRTWIENTTTSTRYYSEWYDYAGAVAGGTEGNVHTVIAFAPVTSGTAGDAWTYGFEFTSTSGGGTAADVRVLIGDPQFFWHSVTESVPFSPPVSTWVPDLVSAYGVGASVLAGLSWDGSFPMSGISYDITTAGTHTWGGLGIAPSFQLGIGLVNSGGTNPYDALVFQQSAVANYYDAALAINALATGLPQLRFGVADVYDARIYRSGTTYIKVDDGAGGNVTFDVIGTLYNNGAPVGGGGPATQVDRASGSNGDYLARIKLTADTQYRLNIGFVASTGTPQIQFGPGSTTAPDFRMYRSGTKTLTFDDGAGSETGVTLMIGSSKVLAASDFATPSIALGTAAAAGSGTGLIRSNATIAAFDTTAPVTQAFGDSAATGSIAFAARRDHRHGMPAAPTTATQVDRPSGAAGDFLERVKLTADTTYRLISGIDASSNGEIQFGAGGVAATDVRLWRSSAQTLMVSALSGGDVWLKLRNSGATQDNVILSSSTDGLRFGSGSAAQDLRLYRSGTKTLTIDDTAAGAATVNVVGTLQQGGVGVMTNPFTTTGDIVYYNGTTPTRLAGSAGFLKSTGAAAPTWSAIAESDVTNLVSDLAAKMTNPMTTTQDLIVGGASGAPGRLGKGTADQVLQMDGTGTNVGWRTFTSGAASQVDRSSGAAGDYLARIKLTADTQYRLNAGLDGSSNPTILFGPGSTTAPDMRLYRSAAKTFLFDDNASGAITVTFASTSTVNFGGAGTLDLNNAKLRLPVAAGISLTTTEGYAGYDSTTDEIVVYDGQRQRAVTSAGWLPYAFPDGAQSGATVGTGITLAANGGSVAIPIVVGAHMLLESASVWNTDTTTARTWRWDLYRQYLNNGNAAENTLTRVASCSAAQTFTPTVAALRTITATSAPVYLAPGLYWLVVQSTHATSTFGFGSAVAGTVAVNRGQTKTTTNPNGGTLDFVAATWTKITSAPWARLNGRVFGQTTAF